MHLFIHTKQQISKQKKHKNRILSYVKPFYNKYLDAYKKIYDNKNVKDEEKEGMTIDGLKLLIREIKDQNQLKKERPRQKKLMKHKNHCGFKNDFYSLIQDVYNNLNNNEFQTTVDRETYDLKNAKKFLVRITTQKIGEIEVHELYYDLITPDIDRLKNAKGKGKNKRHKISEVLENLESVFTGTYLHYKDVPSESEESIAERTKLRRQRSDEIANKEKMIDSKLFREYFEYLTPSDK